MEVFFESPGPGSHAATVTVTGADSIESAVEAAKTRIYAEYATDRYEVVITPAQRRTSRGRPLRNEREHYRFPARF